MQFVEYGAENDKVILLLHGGGLAPWNYYKEADILKEHYHVVIPILDGHNGNDRDFTTIEDNASSLIDHIDKKFGGHVLLIGGLSLGGQILVEMLSQRSNICEYAVIESALVLPMKITARLIKPTFSMSYPLVKKQWFAKLQFAFLHINPTFFDVYFRDSAAITKENMIRFLVANANYKIKSTLAGCRAKTLVFVGEKEQAIMKKSAQMIHQNISNSLLEIISGYRHGELSINHPDMYAEKVYQLIGKH